MTVLTPDQMTRISSFLTALERASATSDVALSGSAPDGMPLVVLAELEGSMVPVGSLVDMTDHTDDPPSVRYVMRLNPHETGERPSPTADAAERLLYRLSDTGHLSDTTGGPAGLARSGLALSEDELAVLQRLWDRAGGVPG